MLWLFGRVFFILSSVCSSLIWPCLKYITSSGERLVRRARPSWRFRASGVSWREGSFFLCISVAAAAAAVRFGHMALPASVRTERLFRVVSVSAGKLICRTRWQWQCGSILLHKPVPRRTAHRTPRQGWFCCGKHAKQQTELYLGSGKHCANFQCQFAKGCLLNFRVH